VEQGDEAGQETAADSTSGEDEETTDGINHAAEPKANQPQVEV
jgi:hypothetical protein